MAFSDFTLGRLKKEFNIQHKVVNLFPIPPAPVEPSERLKLDMEEGLAYPHMTEKAKSEWLVAPILKELRRNMPYFSVFSGYPFDIDKEHQLNGACDFILTAKTDIIELEAPVFCLVEAKRDVLEDGLGQCAAAMLAARKFNQRDHLPVETISGAVTNAYDWVFLRLEGETILVDSERYSYKNLEQLFGVLEHILGQYVGASVDID